MIHPLHESRLGRVLARYRFRLVAVVLAGIAVVNLAQIPGIERDSPFSEMRAIGRHDTSDIAAFTYDTCSWCRERYGLYLALGTVAPGARVIIPTPNSYQNNRAEQDETATRLRVYGRASQIDWVPSPVAAGPGFDPQPDILASGTGGAPEVAIDANGAHAAPWALAVDPATMPANRGDPEHYLDSIATGEGPTRSTRVREFVLIRWAHPRGSFQYQNLLVETVLLPPALRESLSR